MYIENINNTNYIKVNDTATRIQLKISDNLGNPFDLKSAMQVVVVIGNRNGRILSKIPNLLDDTGVLEFGLDEGDLLEVGGNLSEVGDNLIEVHIIMPNGEKFVAPSSGHYKLRVTRSIDTLGEKVTTVTLDYFVEKVDEKIAELQDKIDYVEETREYFETHLDETVDLAVDNKMTPFVDEVSARLAHTSQELEKTYSASESFDPIVIAKAPRGRHLGFGSIERLATLDGINQPNINLAVWRNGANHQADGKIEGVYVNDRGYSMGEPFLIASPEMFPNKGRNGIETPNDFRDPNLLRLPDGRILLTFFAHNWDGKGGITHSESYAMVGEFDASNRTISWSDLTLLFDTTQSFNIYGKPIIDGDNIYATVYTRNTTDSPPDFLTKGYVVGTTVSNPLNWQVMGSEFYTIQPFQYSEAIIRKRPNGGYFIQVRYEGAGSDYQIHRFDSDNITGPWSGPVVIYEGSSHAKGLEFFDDGSYFTGIRLRTKRPGIAILTSEGNAQEPTQLKLSGVVSTSQTDSAEGGYMEFLKINDEEYLGTFHTEAGRTIQATRFTVAMIKNKTVKENDSAFPMPSILGAERIDPFIHIKDNVSISRNTLINPMIYTPYGFPRPPAWSGQSFSTSGTGDIVGAGYAKMITAGGSAITRPKRLHSRLFEGKPLVAAARIYCETPNRVRIRVNYGVDYVSNYHSGNGWETLYIKQVNRNGYSIQSTGTREDDIRFEIQTSVIQGDPITYFVDWTVLGYGETMPEIINDTAERLMSLCRLPLTEQNNTFNFADIGFPTPALTDSFAVNILNTTDMLKGYYVRTTSTGFTIHLSDDSLWGTNRYATCEIVGV